MNNFFFFIFLFFSIFSFAQTTILGKIQDENHIISGASITLRDSLTQNIIAYAYSDQQGKYRLETNLKGNYILQATALGYETKSILLNLEDSTTEIIANFTLQEKALSLDEVIIQAEKPISVKNDTVRFKTKFFVDGTEETAEDLLKKIPGLQIDDEGNIKVGNKEIEKLLVDGDDLFEKGYKILSKSLPAQPIEEVEVLNDFSNNRLLKGIEESDKVAINLKLDEKAKRIWFGSLSAGVGNDSFYDLKANIANFGKKNKYYFIAGANTVGFDATGDIDQLIRPFRINEPGSIGDDQQLRNLINLTAPRSIGFKKARTNFNNAELGTLNAIFNPTKKLKIKTLGFFNSDENDFFRNNINTVTANGANFVNTEDFELRNEKQVFFGKLDLTYNISNTSFIETTTKYSTGNFDDRSDLNFNGTSTIQDLAHRNRLFDQKVNYSNKFTDKKVLLLTGRYINEESPQDFSVNQFFFQDLFPGLDTANNVLQESTKSLHYAGIDAHLLDRKKNDDLLEVQLGNQFRQDQLNSTFSILENNNVLANPGGFQNQLNYHVNDLYVKGKYRKAIGAVGITASAEVHQLFNNLETEQEEDSEAPFYINPRIGLDWKVNPKNRITSSYSFNTTNARINDVFGDFVLTGFRSFNQGTNSFNQLTGSSINFNYQLGDWSDRFFANTLFLYSRNNDFFSTNSTIEQNFTLVEKIRIQDREFINVNTKLDYYFKFISSNLKLDLGYSRSEFSNVINNSSPRQIVSSRYNYGLELRSGFDGIFNFHLGTKWTTSQIETTIDNSFTNNTSFVDLSFVFNEKIDAQVQSERYEFGNLQTDDTFYFLDFEVRYKVIKNKLNLGVTGKNLFNTTRFRNFSISDIGTSTTDFRLLPRFVLLEATYRF